MKFGFGGCFYYSFKPKWLERVDSDIRRRIFTIEIFIISAKKLVMKFMRILSSVIPVVPLNL